MERKAGTAVKPGETELARQLEYIRAIRAENDAFAAENGRKKKFYSLAMGCQMNAHDSEKLEGMLDEMALTEQTRKQRPILSSTTPAVCAKTRSRRYMASWAG